MSILKVANVHFDSAGSNRIDYLGDDKVRITSANGTVFTALGDFYFAQEHIAIRRDQNYSGNSIFAIYSTDDGGSNGTGINIYSVTNQDEFLFGIGTVESENKTIINTGLDKNLEINSTDVLVDSTNLSLISAGNTEITSTGNSNITSTGNSNIRSIDNKVNITARKDITLESYDTSINLYAWSYITLYSGDYMDITAGANKRVNVNSSLTVTDRINASSIAVNSGNILIGRTDSTVGLGVKLDVNGKINSAGILVDGVAFQGGAELTNQSTVNELQYLTFTTATTGTATSLNVASSKLTFNVNTGTLSSTIFNSTSDINKKTNITQITDAVTLVNSLNGVRFDWKDNGLPSLGVIAQEVEKVLPELVSDEKSVNYNGIIAVLIQAVKELKAEVEELKRR